MSMRLVPDGLSPPVGGHPSQGLSCPRKRTLGPISIFSRAKLRILILEWGLELFRGARVMPKPRLLRRLSALLLAGVVLAVWIGQRKYASTSPPVSLDDWDIARLVLHLNGQGLRLRAMATQWNGVIERTAFLTTTEKTWHDFNRLPRDPQRIESWSGVVHCERGPGGEDWNALIEQWGDCCLVVGPFLFFGDRELLDRIRALLMAPK
jgi:hypothetical protein